MLSPIAFCLFQQPNVKLSFDRSYWDGIPIQELIKIQYFFFQLLSREPIRISLRYFWNCRSASDQALQIFLIFSTEIQDLSRQNQIKQKIDSILSTSEFCQIYLFQPIDLKNDQFHNITNLDWVSALVEIHKAETIDNQGYYLPHPFPTNNEHDMVRICERLARIHYSASPEKFLFEITLQPYNDLTKTTQWHKALDTLINAHAKVTNSSQDVVLATLVKEICDYQTRYNHAPLFNYSIKLLAESDLHLSLLAFSWLQNATSTEYANLHHHLPIIKRGEPGFQESLQATCEVRVSSAASCLPPSLQTWQQQFGDRPIREIFGSASMYWGDGSTKRPPHYTPPPQPPAPSQPNLPSHSSPPSSSSLTTTGGHAITQWQGWQHQQREPAKMRDLLPLRYLTTLEEISSFLRVVIPSDRPIPGMPIASSSTNDGFPQSFTIHDLINQFGHLITEDTYVAGVDCNGNPCISDFSKLAHRLVGGMNGTGKTNYILSVVYQFLHANPEREVFMIDFQAGLHYEFTIQKRPSVKMVTTFEDCDQMLKDMVEKHAQRREEMRSYQCRGRKELFEKTGIKQNAVLVIIDEAFYIKNADRAYIKSIETNLNTLAAQARVTGIHILYSTQTPTSDVIDSQTLNNIGERVVFAIESASDSRRIIGTDEAYELPLIPKGRALFKGTDRSPIRIATPLVPDEVW